MRRKFFEARETDAQADEMLALIGEIYDVEKLARESQAGPAMRYDLRQLKTVPVLARVKQWLDDKKEKALSMYMCFAEL